MTKTLFRRAYQRVQVFRGFLAEFADDLLQGRTAKLFEAHLVRLDRLIRQERDGLSQFVFLVLRFRPNGVDDGIRLSQQILAGFI